MNIGKSTKEQRALHWKQIASKVRTHEGELLKGKKGLEYQTKYSKQYLGKDLSADRVGINSNLVERYEKLKR